MWPRSLVLSALSALLVLTACAHGESLTPEGGFHHPLGREHPLVGRVWSTVEARFVSPQLLLSHVRASHWLLLGETHDNVDHHRLEAQLLEVFLSTHPQASVGFEMLDETQAPLLEPPASDAAAFAQRVGWAHSGWPEFALYEPVFALLLSRHARIFAAHPSREHVREAMHELPADQRLSLHLEAAPPAALASELGQEIRDSHCGYAPEAMVEPMVRAQLYKDAFMARALAQAGAPAALVAGRGHVHNQRGVPRALRMHGVEGALTVALVDVDDARQRPSDYDSRAHDFLVFTPRTTDQSACERFKEQLERMRKGPQAR